MYTAFYMLMVGDGKCFYYSFVISFSPQNVPHQIVELTFNQYAGKTNAVQVVDV